MSCPSNAEIKETIYCNLTAITNGRSVNVIVDFGDSSILNIYGINNQTLRILKKYSKPGVFNISAIMVNNTNNQLIRDNKQISVKSKSIFTILSYDASRFMLNSSNLINILSRSLLMCLSICSNNPNCESLIFDYLDRKCIQYNKTQFITGLYTDNRIGIIYKK